jgi:hypothetical protein
MRRALIISISVPVLLLVIVFIIGNICASRERQQQKPWVTCSSLLYLASRGCGDFKKQHGTWPATLDELRKFRGDVNEASVDAWDHDVKFTAFDPVRGYGELFSYGQDGKPGGVGADSDLVIRFPVLANRDWNRQQALSMGLPRGLGGDTNWYEQYNK